MNGLDKLSMSAEALISVTLAAQKDARYTLRMFCNYLLYVLGITTIIIGIVSIFMIPGSNNIAIDIVSTIIGFAVGILLIIIARKRSVFLSRSLEYIVLLLKPKDRYVKVMAKALDRDEDEVRHEVKKMIKKQYLRNVTFDESKDCVVINEIQ